jgi:predicted nucleic acid-binding protein
MFLLDVNVLFARLSQTHVASVAVKRWLQTADVYATCGMTQLGAFRLLLQTSPMRGEPLTRADAHTAIARFTSNQRHIFLPCPALASSIVGQTGGHKAAVDDYYVQIASDAGCRLATLDRALATRWPERTFLIH